MLARLKSDVKNICKILRFASEWKAAYAFWLIFSSAVSFPIALSMAFIIGSLIEQAANGEMTGFAGNLILLLFLLMLLLAMSALADYKFSSICVKSASKVREALIRSSINLPLRSLDDKHSGDLVSRLDSDANLCLSIIQNFMLLICRTILTFALGVTVAFLVHWQIALALLSVGVVLMCINFGFTKKMSKNWAEVGNQKSSTVAQLSDILAGWQVIRVYGKDTGLLDRFAKSCRMLFSKEMKALNYSSAYFGFNQLNAGLTFAASVGIGLLLFRSGLITITLIPVLMELGNQVVKPLSDMGRHIVEVQRGLAGAKRVSEIFDEAQKQQGVEAANKIPYAGISKSPEVKISDLNFTYSNGTRALSGINLTIPPGAKAAFVGSSGSGKSTLLKLIMGLDAFEGTIEIDGNSITSLDESETRKLSAYVSQDCPLFDGSIMENIKLGNPDSDDAEAITAAKQAQVDEFAESFRDRYDTFVGEGGIKISGGQKQRISIARAMLKNANLLLLDEITSALDSAAEDKIIKSLVRISQDKTIITVAHRLSTIVDSDIIFVFEDGSIIESGTHEELYSQKGKYAELFNLQINT